MPKHPTALSVGSTRGLGDFMTWCGYLSENEKVRCNDDKYCDWLDYMSVQNSRIDNKNPDNIIDKESTDKLTIAYLDGIIFENE